MREISWFFSICNQFILEISQMKHIYRPHTAYGSCPYKPYCPPVFPSRTNSFFHHFPPPWAPASSPTPSDDENKWSDVTLSTSHRSPTCHLALPLSPEGPPCSLAQTQTFRMAPRPPCWVLALCHSPHLHTYALHCISTFYFQVSPKRNVLTPSFLRLSPLSILPKPTMLTFFLSWERNSIWMSHYDQTQHVDKAAQAEAAFQRPVPLEIHQPLSP